MNCIRNTLFRRIVKVFPVSKGPSASDLRNEGRMFPLFLLAVGLAAAARANDAPFARHVEPFALDSRKQRSSIIEGGPRFSRLVISRKAPWLQLHFAEWKLSQGSYLLLTSQLDGGQQRFDAASLQTWRGFSACFNGEAVVVELYTPDPEAADFIVIEQITVGNSDGGEPGGSCSWPCGICDGDDRVPSNDSRVARTFPGGCTGWLVSNGACLSAGHCEEDPGWQLQMLQFNVPLSTCSGGRVNPPPEDQYPVIESSIVWQNAGTDDDWAVFRCGPNSNTGLLPHHAQSLFFRMARDEFPTQARVTGYGIDADPPGCTDDLNEYSQTQQTDSGGFSALPQNPAFLSMGADLTCGDSGGPVIHPNAIVALGIVTRCTESCFFVSNHGTGFANLDLASRLEMFPGPVVRYVDAGHPISQEDGSVFRPFDTVPEAVAAAPTGSIISIVAGSYPAAMGNIIVAGADGKALTLQAPVGTVVIGN